MRPEWLPITSDPDVMNQFLKKLGLEENYKITDVVSLDDDCLSSISTTPVALLLLFPLKANPDSLELQDKMEELDQDELDDIYYIEQTCANVCGTIALIHAIANSEGVFYLKPRCVLNNFLYNTAQLSPKQRGQALQNHKYMSNLLDNCLGFRTELPPRKKRKIEEADSEENEKLVKGSPRRETGEEVEIIEIDSSRSSESDSDEMSSSCSGKSYHQHLVESDHHFIAIVNSDGKLVELDGIKPGPVFHGPTSEETFLKDASRVCKEYMERTPDNPNFTVLAFGT